MNNNNNSGRAFLIIVLILIFCVVLYLFVASKNNTKTSSGIALNSATGFSPLNTYSNTPDANGNVSNPYPYDFSTPTAPAPTPIIPIRYAPIAVAPVSTPTPTPAVTPETPVQVQEAVQQQAAQATLNKLQASYYDTSYTPPADNAATTDTAATPGSNSSFDYVGGVAGGLAGSAIGMLFGDPVGGSILGGLIGGGGLDKLMGGGSSGAIGGISGAGGLAGGGAVVDFGGTVKKNIRCTCSTSNMMTIQDTSGQQIDLLFTPGVSQATAGANTNGTGQQALGKYTTGGQCMMTGDPCQSQGQPKGTIKTIGTS